MPEDQVVVAARRIANAAGRNEPSPPAIPDAAPTSAGEATYLAAKLKSLRWARVIVRRYVTVASDYSTLEQMASAIDAMILELEDAGLTDPPEMLLDTACLAGRKLRDSFLIQANMASKSSDPQFNPLVLEQASDRVTKNFDDFLTAMGKVVNAAK